MSAFSTILSAVLSDSKWRYLRRLQEAAAAAAVHTERGLSPNGALGAALPQRSPAPQTAPMVPSNILPSPTLSSPFPEHPSPHSPHPRPFAHSASPTSGTPPIPPSRYPIAADMYNLHHPTPILTSMSYVDPPLSEPVSGGSPLSTTNGRPSMASVVPASHSGSHTYSGSICSPSVEFPQYPLYNWSPPFRHKPTNIQPHAPTLPPLSYFVRPHRLEDVAHRDIIILIISLFFDFVYPLTPCIHKPSFMADLQSRREERDPLFFALVMSTIASTCVQVPRSYLPLERREVRKLAQTCHEASRHISVASYDPPTSTHVVIRYLYVSISIQPLPCSILTATRYIIFVRDTMLRRMPLSARRRILQ